jgi:uncharacterized protein
MSRYYATFISPQRSCAVGKQSLTRFDALKLAERSGSVAGHVDSARLLRLADRIVQPSDADHAHVQWSVAGGRDAQGRSMLTVEIEGRLLVVCQRCLRPLAVPIEQQTELLLARDEAELARLDVDEQEVILAAAPLDALTLIEDELLLSLPFAPCHAKDECAAAVSPMPLSEVPSPFARLAGLKAGSRSRS